MGGRSRSELKYKDKHNDKDKDKSVWWVVTGLHLGIGMLWIALFCWRYIWYFGLISRILCGCAPCWFSAVDADSFHQQDTLFVVVLFVGFLQSMAIHFLIISQTEELHF